MYMSCKVHGRDQQVQHDCHGYDHSSRPRWATLHPDNWTVIEVGEWLRSVAEEYSLGRGVKVSWMRAFCDVNGRRLMAMTLQNFIDLDPIYGHLLHSVFRDVVMADCLSGFSDRPWTLTAISEADTPPYGPSAVPSPTHLAPRELNSPGSEPQSASLSPGVESASLTPGVEDDPTASQHAQQQPSSTDTHKPSTS